MQHEDIEKKRQSQRERTAKSRQLTREVLLSLSAEDDEEYRFTLSLRKLILEGNMNAMIYGVLLYTAYRINETNCRKNFGQMFGEDLEKIHVNDLHSTSPEAAYLYKEQLRYLVQQYGLDPLDTSGVEPLQSNFSLAPTFLELYGPIDSNLRLADAVIKAKKDALKKQRKTKAKVQSTLKRSRLLDTLRAGFRETIRTHSHEFSRVDGRKIPLTELQGKQVNVYQKRELVNNARERQDKRNHLFDKEVPLVKIEYYTTKRKRRNLLEPDRQLLQAVGEWRAGDERRFPTDDNVEVERISSSKAVQNLIRKQRSKRLLSRPQHTDKSGTTK